MAVKEMWYRQDMNKPVQVRQFPGAIFTEDNNGDLIGVECYRGNLPYDLSDSVVGYIIKEDGTTESVNGSISGNRAWITLPATALDVSGIVHIAIRVTQDSTKSVLLALQAVVQRSRSEIVNTSGRTIYGIDDLLAQIAAVEQATTNANNAASSASDAASVANTKAGLANDAATAANAAATKIDGMTVESSTLAPGSSATAVISEVNNHKHIEFGIPKGDTGTIPSLSIGTVATLNPDQSASATITGTAENPVLNLSLPRGQTGTITNAFGSNIQYSESDSRTIKQVVDALPSSAMAGATASTAGTAGIVPAPAAGDQNKVLLGNGTWGNEISDLVVLNSVSLNRAYGSAIGANSIAVGTSNIASEANSFAEGNDTRATGECAHAEGWNMVTASGKASHAEGSMTTASGSFSHAEGNVTTAARVASHAEGYGTIASSNYQHVSGQYNIEDTQGVYAEIIGNGTYSVRSNARTLDWDGNEVLAGDLTINNASNPVAVSKMIITPSTAFAIPEAGTSVSYDMEGLTVNHRLIAWGFSESPENSPPTALSWETGNAMFNITNNGAASRETIKPIFALPTAVAITEQQDEEEGDNT